MSPELFPQSRAGTGNLLGYAVAEALGGDLKKALELIEERWPIIMNDIQSKNERGDICFYRITLLEQMGEYKKMLELIDELEGNITDKTLLREIKARMFM